MRLASRIPLVLAIAIASMACGVVLPSPEEGERDEPGSGDPVTPKGVSMPSTPSGGEGSTGVAVNAAPDQTADAGAASVPSSSPARMYFVFVTAEEWSAKDIGGLTGADEKCSAAASRGALALRGKRWVAWLSNEVVGARSRLGGTPGPWVRPDALMVASSPSQLVNDTPLFVPIAMDESLGFRSGDVWTGTFGDGTSAEDTCEGWTGTDGRGAYGKIDYRKPAWTSYGDASCEGGFQQMGGNYNQSGARNHLYCFEVD